MNAPQPRVTVSILVLAWPPNQHRPANVFTLLNSLADASTRAEEVIVVCNGDAPELAKTLAAHPIVSRVVAPRTNLGVAAGWNAAAAAASGQILVFANEDVVVGPSTIQRLVQAAIPNGVGVAGFSGSTWDPKVMWQSAAEWSHPASPETGVRVVAGYLFAVPRQVWLKIGGVNARLSPAFFEEVDLAMRVSAAGYSVVVTTDDGHSHLWGISAMPWRHRITWDEQTAAAGTIHRRNHRQMLAWWSPQPWRAWAYLHIVLYYRAVILYRLRRLASRWPHSRPFGPTYSQRMARGAISGLGAMLAARLIGIIALPLVIGLLGVPLYGAWVIASILISTQGLFDLGMAATTARYTAQAEARNDRRAGIRVASTGLVVYSLLSVAVGASLVLLAPQLTNLIRLPPSLRADGLILFWGAALLFAISSYTVVAGSVLLGLQRLHWANAAAVVSQVCYFVTLMVARWMALGVRGVLLAMGTLYLVQLSIMVAGIWRWFPNGPSTGPPPTVRELTAFGGTVQLIVIADFIALQLPKVLAASLGGAVMAARLDVAMRLPFTLTSIALPLLPPLLPAASRLTESKDDGRMRDLVSRSLQYVSLLALPMFAVLLAFGPEVLKAWVGPVGDGAGLTLRLLSIAALAHVLPGVLTSLALGSGKAELVLRYKLVLVLCLILLSPLVMTGDPLEGIAADMALSFSLASAYLAVTAKRFYRRVGLLLAPMVRVGGVAALSVGVGLLADHVVARGWSWVGLLTGLVVSSIAYAIILLTTGILKPTEVANLLGSPAVERSANSWPQQ